MTPGNGGRTDIPRTTFWAYDIFGYLLPGVLLLLTAVAANARIAAIAKRQIDTATAVHLTLLFIVAYIVGHAIAAISSRVLERVLLRRLWDYPTTPMFTAGGGKTVGKSSDSYLRPYSPDFQRNFDKMFRATFEYGETPIDSYDRFWLSWEYIALHHPTAFRRATHFLELYGFSRNVSMAFLLAAPLAFTPGWLEPIPQWAWLTATLFLSVVFFANYMKLVRRMTDEIYRAFYVAARPGDR
jgi:hypothetical protein